MKIRIESFGRKYGMPQADVVVDVRCLENPFWVDELRNMSGLDAPVKEYIFSNSESVDYVQKLAQLLQAQAKLAQGRQSQELHIAVGCTGGRHRSVAVAEYLAQNLCGYEIEVCHTDIGKG